MLVCIGLIVIAVHVQSKHPMNKKSKTFGLMSILVGMAVLSGCGAFRWSGYSKRRDGQTQSSRSNSGEATRSPLANGGSDDFVLSEYPKTPTEHLAAAKLYREKAAHYLHFADRHGRMKAIYETLPHEVTRHCDSVIKNYEELAKDFDGLADFHEQQALKPRK